MKIDLSQVVARNERSKTAKLPNDRLLTISSQDESSTSLSPHDLRLAFESIQSAQGRLNIQSQAAMPFEPISGALLLKIGGAWLATILGAEGLEYLNENVISKVGEEFYSELAHPNNNIRNAAVDKLKNAAIESIKEKPTNDKQKLSFKDPQEIIKSAELVLRDLLIKSVDVSGENLENSKCILSSLTALLEGLYEIDDSKSDKKIYLGTSTQHGWQNTTPWKYGLKQTIKVIKTVNPFHWNKKHFERTFTDVGLLADRGWHKYDTAYDMCAAVLEYAHSGKFKSLNKQAITSLRRILILNRKVPVTSASLCEITGSRIPSYTRSEVYRAGMYETMIEILERDDDPLLVKSDINDVPVGRQKQATEFREKLLEAYKAETGLYDSDRERCSESACNNLQKILDKATGIPRHEWNEEAKKRKLVEEQNQRNCQIFCDWGSIVSINGKGYPKSDLEKMFNQLSQPQRDQVDILQTFNSKQSFPDSTELNKELLEVLTYMRIESTQDGEKLTQENSQKGLYFLRYINQILAKQVNVNSKKVPIESQLSDNLRNYLIVITRPIVHNIDDFPATARNYEFFITPEESSTSVPGQALILHQSITRSFSNNGYADVYGLKDRLVSSITTNLYGKENKYESGFLFSGPKGTGKSSLAVIIANQMALPLIALSPDMLRLEEGNTFVKYGGQEVTLSTFLDEVRNNSPCVFLMDEVEGYLKPRSKDNGEFETPNPIYEQLTTNFLNPLQSFRDKNTGRAQVAVIMTTNAPKSTDINIDSINKDGLSPSAEYKLYSDVSDATFRDRRVDFRIFSFHKLYNEQQGQQLASHFLRPLIDSNRLAEPDDFFHACRVLSKYTPATIETAIATVLEVKKRKFKFDDIEEVLKTKLERKIERKNPKLVKLISSIVTTFVEVEELKTIGKAIDYDLAAESANELTNLQINDAIRNHTSCELTTENIIEAFNKIRDSISSNSQKPR